jgi:hypothetical protein
MKTILTLLAVLSLGGAAFSQTTAMNFTGEDCNGNSVDLFADLDAGKAVMLIFYMPNCGTCPPVAAAMQSMANNINASHPGLVKAYAFPFQNSTTCAYSSSWVTNNSLSLFAPMDSGAVQVAYYGGFGMPTVVLLGGDNHDVLFVTQDFTAQDTTTMRDAILNTFTAGIPETNAISSLEVFPNPSSDAISLTFEALADADCFIELVDLEGKQVLLAEQHLLKGIVQQQLDIRSVPAGSYVLRLGLNGSVATQQVQVIR